MPGPDCRKSSPEPGALADDEFYVRRMKEILQRVPVVDGPDLLAGGGGSGGGYAASQLQPVQLLEHVFIGSQRNADSVDVLRRHGITHVLNCAGLRRYDFTRSPYPKETGIKGFLMISAEDSEDYDIKRHFPEAIAFLDDVKRARGRSLVHCNLGVNRSGAVVAAYLMVSERRTLLDVVQYLRSKRSLILANKGFRRQLVAFARERRLLDPVIVVDDEKGGGWTEARLNNNSLLHAHHNGTGPSSSRHVPPPSVVVVSDSDQSSAVSSAAAARPLDADGGQDGRGHSTSTSRHGSWLLSPVYEQRADVAAAAGSLTASGGVLGGFLTLFGAGAASRTRRPLRSTSFSNVASSCGAPTSTTSTAPGTSSTTAAVDERRGTLSTARPLRVYTRSSTDTELYRRRPVSARPPIVVRQQFSERHGRPSD